MKPNRVWKLVCALALCWRAWGLVSADDLAIDSFSRDGVLRWTYPTNGVKEYRVEGSQALGSGQWTNDLGSIAPTGAAMSASVPMSGARRFYRLVAATNAVSASVDYLVIDLSAGPAASNYPVSYMARVPAGGWTDEYKATKLVLRRIPAGSFIMGSPTNELGRLDSAEVRHQVTLTQPFYIGVFEVTQRQWERVVGTWPSSFANASYRDSRPVEQVKYTAIRGSNAGAAWPTNGNVDAESFMGRLRARTDKAFDLPTESQWEYAGRAGTTTALNSGKNLTDFMHCPNMDEVGRYVYNGGFGAMPDSDTSLGTAKVGSYLPNAWGLYDVHGNVWEWCLDWYGSYPGKVSDPKGAVSGADRMFRGGSWVYYNYKCRVAIRDKGLPDTASYDRGFRVALPLGQ